MSDLTIINDDKIEPVVSYYNFQYVFCVDITGDMNDSFDNVCEFIMNVCDSAYKLNDKYKDDYNGDYKDDYDCRKIILNTRFVLFKDYQYDANPIIKSDFFDYVTQKDEFFKFLVDNSLEYSEKGRSLIGGGDIPESVYEALYIAINSNWDNKKIDFKTKTRYVNKNIIILITNSGVRNLEDVDRDNIVNYPKDMPKTTEELRNYWNTTDKISKHGKRLLVFSNESFLSSFYNWDYAAEFYKERKLEFDSSDVNAASTVDFI